MVAKTKEKLDKLKQDCQQEQQKVKDTEKNVENEKSKLEKQKQTCQSLKADVNQLDVPVNNLKQRQNNLDKKSKVADILKNQATQKREAHLANDQELSQLTSTLKNPSMKIPRTQLNIQQARLLIEKPQQEQQVLNKTCNNQFDQRFQHPDDDEDYGTKTDQLHLSINCLSIQTERKSSVQIKAYVYCR